MKSYLHVTFEAAFPIDADIAQAIQTTLDDLRGQGAARAVASRVLADQKEYDKWYAGEGISEIEVPSPDTIVIRFD